MAYAARKQKTPEQKPMKDKRLETRVTPEQKDLFLRAAMLEGKTLTDFVLSALQESANRVIDEHALMHLVLQDSKLFVDALLNPPEPSSRLRKAVARHGKKG